MEKEDKYFIDWESHVFGVGYGSGEAPILCVLKRFLELCNKENAMYSSGIVEEAIGKSSTWLLINTLCRAGIITYGGSPHNGRLTTNGKALKAYVTNRKVSQLVSLLWNNSSYTYCFPDECQCDNNDCNNPFFKR